MKLKDIHLRDPFILPFEGMYYLYGSRGGEAFGECTGFDVYVSKDLEHWSEPIEAFTPLQDFWSHKHFWAPEVHLYKEKFYMFASFISETRKRGTQILVSTSPMGPFEVHSEGPVTPEEWNCLDGTLYVDEQDNPYMIFCREWLQSPQPNIIGEMWAIALSKDLDKGMGNPIYLFKANDPVWVDQNRKVFVTDGPFMYKTQNGKKLLLWSSFGPNGYCNVISRLEGNIVSGKWIHCQDIFFRDNGGHGNIFRTFSGALMFVCHQPNDPPKERPVIFEAFEQNDMLYLYEK